jgi:ATP-dependent DNA ligase
MIEKTLYARSSTGAILEWYMERLADKYRTYSGQQGGGIVCSEWTTALPKNEGKANETTGVMQAITEVDAAYKKKLKLKYKENIADIDVKEYVSPMLAKKYKDYAEKLDFSKGEWLAQIKFNGVRCVATKDGLFSRKGERFETIPHIEENLKNLFLQNPTLCLDGELYNYDLRQQLNELMKLVRRTVNITSEDLIQSEQMVRYYIYDGYGFASATNPYHILWHDNSYSIRKSLIDNIIHNNSKYLREVQDYSFSSIDELMEIYNGQIEDGQEGLILRRWDAQYENKRSKNLLKMKPEDSSEGVIQDIKEGTGNWSGMGKVITLRWNDKIFDASFKGTMGECTQFLKDKEQWIAKEVTFLYNGLTGLGTPNFARVDYNNCLKN